MDRDGPALFSENSIDPKKLPNQRAIAFLKERIFDSDIFYSSFCGLIFIAVFSFAYSLIPAEFYQLRDDGVITLSHAKNWIDYGFIGLGPSGERVEGYSAPAQFFVYAVLYGLTGISYDLFARVQTIACTFLLGFVFAKFFSDDKKIGLGVAFVVALVIANLTPFLEWHGSGMENAITHVLFLSSFYILFRGAESERVSYWLSTIVFLASISRLESVFHIAPLLVIFSIHGVVANKSYRAFKFSILVFVFWAAFQLWRVWYFGDIKPNTAYAQEISVIGNLHSLMSFDPGFIYISVRISLLIFIQHGGFLLIPLAYLLFVRGKGGSVGYLAAITASLVMSSVLNPMVFGQTRLDFTRSTTQMAVVVAMIIPVIVYHVERQRGRLWRVPAACIVSLALLVPLKTEPYEVCCPIDGFDTVRATFETAAQREGLPRPTVANPDLGIVSWGKQFNIVDLGWLGSPILTKLRAHTALSDYFFDYAAPDLIESHGVWTCWYADTIFADPRFAERYVSWGEAAAPVTDCADGESPPTGYWIRRDILADSGSDERRLIDEIQAGLSAERLGQALSRCQRQAARRCAYVARTAYRFLPEFVDSGQHDDLLAIFGNSRTREFDLYLLNGRNDGQAHLAAIDHIVDRHARNEDGPL